MTGISSDEAVLLAVANGMFGGTVALTFVGSSCVRPTFSRRDREALRYGHGVA
jgi:hypothetical protein